MDLDNLRGKIFIVTDPNKPDNPIESVDELFARWVGYESSEMVGKNCRFLQGDEPDPGVKEAMATIVKSKKPGIITVTNYTRSGQRFLNTFEVEPCYDANGNLMVFLGRHLKIVVASVTVSAT